MDLAKLIKIEDGRTIVIHTLNNKIISEDVYNDILGIDQVCGCGCQCQDDDFIEDEDDGIMFGHNELCECEICEVIHQYIDEIEESKNDYNTIRCALLDMYELGFIDGQEDNC